MIDYMVMEAVAIKVDREDAEKQKEEQHKAKTKEWKKDTSELEQFR